MDIGYTHYDGTLYSSKEHMIACLDRVERCFAYDARSRALFYCLTITPHCREHFDDCYDREMRSIKSSCITKEWMNEEDKRCVRLGFNLYDSFTPTEYNIELDKTLDVDDEIRQAMIDDERDQYLPRYIFDSKYMPYMLEAVRIRFS